MVRVESSLVVSVSSSNSYTGLLVQNRTANCGCTPKEPVQRLNRPIASDSHKCATYFRPERVAKVLMRVLELVLLVERFCESPQTQLNLGSTHLSNLLRPRDPDFLYVQRAVVWTLKNLDDTKNSQLTVQSFFSCLVVPAGTVCHISKQ